MIKIKFGDDKSFIIELLNNPVADYIQNSFKHLQNLDLDIAIYDMPNTQWPSKDHIVTMLKNSAVLLDIDIDLTQILEQEYLNTLHKIFENGYDGKDTVWLDFHESIHMIESYENTRSSRFTINYRQKGGPLTRKFDRKNLTLGSTFVSRGTCYVHWNELGKTPFRYFNDGEPSSIERILQLVKPWVYLKPVISIALKDQDIYEKFEERKDEFNRWFAPFKDQWCQYWNLEDWNPTEMFTIIPIGHLPDIDRFSDLLDQNILPTRISCKPN
tara:strand:- start:3721 stop:4533 length:813 start_codon:yes stop_codon:yes gene_type:complete